MNQISLYGKLICLKNILFLFTICTDIQRREKSKVDPRTLRMLLGSWRRKEK
jgi:hypothetical protein